MLVLGCSDSGDSGGCGSSTARCDINSTATVCGDLITDECFGDETPEAESQCEEVLKQDDETVYCCTAAGDEVVAETGVAGGGGS